MRITLNRDVMMSSVQSDKYTSHKALFSTLSPGYVSSDALRESLDAFSQRKVLVDRQALFDTEVFHTEIFQNVDALLAYYQANMTAASARSYQVAKAEKDLTWVALQLFARLQAIDADVGVIAQPMTEFKKRQQQLVACIALLRRAQIDTSKIEKLFDFAPKKSEEELKKQASWEEWFQAFLDEIDKRNDLRLFWVWGRSSLDEGLGALGQTDAQQRLNDTTYLPGQISWSLYLFRGSLYLYQYLQKRCSDPVWLKKLSHLTPKERDAYIAAYQKMHWDVYKYRILNDLVFWGPINLACFGWWLGEGFYGWLGNFATVILLCVDVYLAELKQAETQEKIVKISDSYQLQTRTLSEGIFRQLSQLSENIDMWQTIQSFKGDEKKLLALDAYLFDKLLHNPKEFEAYQALWLQLADWKDVHRHHHDFQRRTQQSLQSMNYDRIYSWALLFAFTMSVSLLLPGGVPMLHVIGTVLCTVLTIAHRVAKAQLDMSNRQLTEERLSQEILRYTRELQGLSTILEPSKDIEARKQTLYQLMGNARANRKYEQGMMTYQHLELLRTSFLRFTVPIAIGLTMVYAPAMIMMVPTYVFVLAASALLSFALAHYTKSQKPEDVTVRAFDVTKYQSVVRQYQFPGMSFTSQSTSPLSDDEDDFESESYCFK